MNSAVLLLVLLSAFFHAIWNLLLRTQSGNTLIIWLGLLIIGSISLVFFGLLGLAIGNFYSSFNINFIGFTCITTSALIHVVYFNLLGKCYKTGDISVIYPIARGSGVGFACLLAAVIFSERVSLGGLAGIMAIISGIFFIKGLKFANKNDQKLYLLAVTVGLCTACYSIIDKIGIGHVNPVLYISSSSLLTALLLSPAIVKQHKGSLKKNIKESWKAAVLVGSGIIGCYLLILYAFQLGEVSYIVAARESSVVIGSILGVCYLKEKLTAGKTFGVLSILLGLILLKLA